MDIKVGLEHVEVELDDLMPFESGKFPYKDKVCQCLFSSLKSNVEGEESYIILSVRLSKSGGEPSEFEHYALSCKDVLDTLLKNIGRDASKPNIKKKAPGTAKNQGIANTSEPFSYSHI